MLRRYRHRLPLVGLVAIAATTTAGPAQADVLPDLDFEKDMAGWTKSGNAFEVVVGDVVRTDDHADVRVGGDYWKGLPYTFGHRGNSWVSSYWRRTLQNASLGQHQGDDAVGSLRSSEFTLTADMKNFSFLIGGGNDITRLRVELEVRAATLAEVPQLVAIGATRGANGLARDGNYVSVAAATGNGRDALALKSFALPAQLTGKTARLRILDESPNGHINVDSIHLDSSVGQRGKVWGFADYHTHPMAHIGFGGLKGIRTLWGVPGGAYDSYVKDPYLIRRDIPQCDNTHLGGRASPWFVQGLEGAVPSFPLFMLGRKDHPHFGADHAGHHDFADFPSYFHGAHEQYHITQIRRAYEGGLRLMSALAVNNDMAEIFMSRSHDKPHTTANHIATPDGAHVIDITPEADILYATVYATRELARINHDWMEIAYTPDGARRIIQEDKLAIILGVEFDHLGSLFPGKSPDEEIDTLYSMGVRQITVLHAIDNTLGAAGTNQDGYNTGNYQWNNRFYGVEDGCLGAHSTRGECIRFRLSKSQKRPIMGRPTALWLAEQGGGGLTKAMLLEGGPMFGSVDAAMTDPTTWYDSQDIAAYDVPAGHGSQNARGLTANGTAYLNAAMRRGLLIDISHMSDHTADTAMVEARNHAKYPLMVSHAGFRAQMLQNDYSDFANPQQKSDDGPFRPELGRNDNISNRCLHTVGGTQGVRPDCAAQVLEYFNKNHREYVHGGVVDPGTVNRYYTPAELDVPGKQIEGLKDLQGVVGLFIAQEPIDDPPGYKTPFTNDCAMSSKGTAAAYMYALSSGLKGVGLATDLGLHGTVVPRFGREPPTGPRLADVPVACGAYRKVGDWDQPELMAIERALNPKQYQVEAQRDGVRYAGNLTRADVGYGSNEPLKPYKMGNRTFDYNVDGLAHFGLVPDLLQDIKNFAGAAAPLDALFRSADSYIAMWEKAWTASGCGTPGHRCDESSASPPVQWDLACRGLCPNSWNQGAPLTPLKSFTERCDGTVRFEGGWMYGSSPVRSTTIRDGEWAVLRADNPSDIVWHCNNDAQHIRQSSTGDACPVGTRYVKVFRGASSPPKHKAVQVDCLAPPYGEDNVPIVLPPVDPPRQSKLIKIITEQCSFNDLSGHPQSVTPRTGTRVSGPAWLNNTSDVYTATVTPSAEDLVVYFDCAGSHEHTSVDPFGGNCPPQTDLITVRRLPPREVHIECFSKATGPLVAQDPRTTGPVIGKKDDLGCDANEDVHDVKGILLTGSNPLRAGQHAFYRLANPRFSWKCGRNTGENWNTCPAGTNVVRLARGNVHHFVMECIRH